IDLENITLRLKETRAKCQKQLPIISENEQKIFGKEVATKGICRKNQCLDKLAEMCQELESVDDIPTKMRIFKRYVKC
ncbi:596_t:CDS:2, partial [Racocetra persica]